MPGIITGPGITSINAQNANAVKALAAHAALPGWRMPFQQGQPWQNTGNIPPNAWKLTLAQTAGKKGLNWAALLGKGGKPVAPGNTSASDGANPGGNPSTAGINPNGTLPNDGNYSDLFQNVLQTALKLYNTPNGAANSLINPKAILGGLAGAEINPTQVGQDAGLGYAAQLAQLQRNYGTTQNQNAQNLADIKNWYGQAADTQAAGAAQNAKDLATQLTGSQDAANAFINALGGSASPAAAGIANASDIANAALRGEGLAGANFDSNMKGVVALDQAQQLQNEQTAGSNRLQTLMDQIAQTSGQQGAAEAQAKDNALQQLFSQKSSLANMKANLIGNLFNEKQGLRQQKLSELSGLSNTILGTALAGPQIQAANLANQNAAATVAARKISNVGLMKQVNALGAAGARDISQANAGTRSSMQQALQNRFLNSDGTLKTDPKAVPSLIVNQLRGVWGLNNNAALQAFAKGIYHDIVTQARVAAWNKTHK